MKGFLYGQTEYNILASANRLEAYIDYAKDNGFDYISITDRNMYGVYKFFSYAKKKGIKPIIGLEYSFNFGDVKTSNVLLYAKDEIGYKNLLKISSLKANSNIDTLDDIKPYLDGILMIFVFNNSILEELLVAKEYNLLNDSLNVIKNYTGYIGISNTNYPFKDELNKEIENYASSFNIICLPIHKCCYLKKDEYKIYETLRRIDGENVSVGANDYSFITNPVDCKELDNIINNINYDIYGSKPMLPKFPCEGNDSKEYLKSLCNKGLSRRLSLNRIDKNKYPVYYNRLEYELGVISKMGYDDYFLIVWDFIRYAKKNDILVGPGRGSAAGSLVGYSLGITDIDPIRYNLLFERFLNPERVTMPDIDTDFPDDRRDDVIKYVKEKYGPLHVCSISTFGTFKLKSSIKDVARVCNVDVERANKIVDMVEKYGYDYLLNQYIDTDYELYEFLRVAKGLENLPRHISTHAAGIIISDKELNELVPLAKGVNDLYQSQFEAHDLEEIGLLKMDFLGLSNLTMIDGMMKDINMSINDLRNIPLNDPKVYRMLSNGDTLGIFQLESRGIRDVLMKLKPNNIMDLVATLALYRPGPMDNIPEFIRAKHEGNINYLHKDLEPILRETYGVIVYQEQIMQIARKFAGFSLGEADILRRAISKKDSSKLDEIKEDFIKRSIKLGYDVNIATQIYELIYKFANYGFNKSHSVAYAYVSYQMAYLKANHFGEFMGNILNNVVSDSKTLYSYIKYAKERGLKVFKPNINISTNKFKMTKEGLFIPFNAIYSLGGQVTAKLLESRDKPFISYDDFRERTPFLNSDQITALIFSGALDMFGKSKKSMCENTNEKDQTFLKYINSKETEEYSFDYLSQMEKKYLGFNLEYNAFRNKNDIIKKYQLLPLSKAKVGQRIRTLVIFTKVTDKNTKKSDKMIVGNMEDDEISYRFIIFPSDLKNIKIKLECDKLYSVFGFLKDEEGNKTFVINDLFEIKG